MKQRALSHKKPWRVVPATLFLISLMFSLPALGQQTASFDLRDFQWKNRLLLVFAPTPEDTAYQDLKKQIHLRRHAFTEHDMVLIEVMASGQSRVGGESLNPMSAARLREQFGMDSEQFSLLLIGKDGGVKLRTQQATDLSEVFALIDTMPMRKREMQRQQQP